MTVPFVNYGRFRCNAYWVILICEVARFSLIMYLFLPTQNYSVSLDFGQVQGLNQLGKCRAKRKNELYFDSWAFKFLF